MTKSQFKGMAEFHKKAAAAYLKYGRTDQAEQAVEQLKKLLKLQCQPTTTK